MNAYVLGRSPEKKCTMTKAWMLSGSFHNDVHLLKTLIDRGMTMILNQLARSGAE